MDNPCDVCGGDLLDGDEPGALLPDESHLGALVCSERCTEVASMELWKELRRVEELARSARGALLDEHEGNIRRDLLEMHMHLARVVDTVASW